MRVMNKQEVLAVSGGDGAATVAGVLVGIAAAGVVVGTGGAMLVGAALGGAIWGGVSYLLSR